MVRGVVGSSPTEGFPERVSTLLVPKTEGGGFHGEVSAATAAKLFEELDLLDLVVIAQIHSHPSEAFLSPIDAERPLVAAPGFLSIIVPSFGFVDLADVAVWRAYEFHDRNKTISRISGLPSQHTRAVPMVRPHAFASSVSGAMAGSAGRHAHRIGHTSGSRGRGPFDRVVGRCRSSWKGTR